MCIVSINISSIIIHIIIIIITVAFVVVVIAPDVINVVVVVVAIVHRHSSRKKVETKGGGKIRTQGRRRRAKEVLQGLQRSLRDEVVAIWDRCLQGPVTQRQVTRSAGGKARLYNCAFNNVWDTKQQQQIQYGIW